MMCANDTRKIFHRSLEEKRYFESRKERRERKLFIREREREDLARAAIKNFFAAIVVVPKLFVLFSFFFLFSCFFNRLLYRQKE